MANKYKKIIVILNTRNNFSIKLRNICFVKMNVKKRTLSALDAFMDSLPC